MKTDRRRSNNGTSESVRPGNETLWTGTLGVSTTKEEVQIFVTRNRQAADTIKYLCM